MLTMQGGDSLVGGLPIIHITYQQYIANPSAYQDPDVIVHISGFPTAGNLPADYVGYDSNLNMEDIGNIATKAIAKVEPSDTALYLHNVGTGFINKDGNYCITDVQISIGGTITLGTNCHVVDGGMNSRLGYKKVYETTSSSETYRTVFNRIYNSVTFDPAKTYILVHDNGSGKSLRYPCTDVTSSTFALFTITDVDSSMLRVRSIGLYSSNSMFVMIVGTTYTDNSTSTATGTFTLYECIMN